MYCFKCGNKVSEDENFCMKCGANIKAKREKETTTIRLKCQECGGTMNIGKNKDVISCPYCGSQRLIIESDDVKIERMHADVENNKVNSYTKIELEKQAVRMREIAIVERKEKWKRYTIIGWIIAMVFFLSLCGIGKLLDAKKFTNTCGGIFGCILLIGIWYFLLNFVKNDQANKSMDGIKISSAVANYKDKNYQKLISELEDIGFWDIKAIPLCDLKFGVFKQPNTVASLTINGENHISSGARFPRDSAVTITYHSYGQRV